MRICIFGSGSLGSALGGILSFGNDVTLIGRRAHVRAVLNKGLRLTGDVRRTVKVGASESIEGLEPPELLVISTKAYDTPDAIAACRDWASDDSLVLTLQNGLGNLEALREWKGDRALGGTTTLGAMITSPGVVRISGLGKTVIGSDTDASAARSVARAFSVSGIPVTTEDDVFGAIWSKAVVSACINPTTAVLRVPNGELLHSRVIVRLLDAVCSECVMVAGSCGVDLRTRALQSRVRAVARETAKNMSSMLQDVQHGRRTEIAQINGAFCRLGESHGVRAPLNRALTSMVVSLRPNTGRQKG